MPEYDLYKEYLDDGSIDALMSCINLFLTTPTNNKEIILAYPGKTNGLYEYHLLPRGSGWAGCISATQNVVDAFFMKNGLSIDAPGSGYVEVATPVRTLIMIRNTCMAVRRKKLD